MHNVNDIAIHFRVAVMIPMLTGMITLSINFDFYKLLPMDKLYFSTIHAIKLSFPVVVDVEIKTLSSG